MMKINVSFARAVSIAAAAWMFGAGVAHAAGDPASGEKLFRRCKSCHKVEEGRNGTGPSLFAVVGRDVAAAPGFGRYSDPFREFGAGKTWDDALLREWLAGPKKLVPGTKMSFGGFKKEKQLDDIIAYLGTLK